MKKLNYLSKDENDSSHMTTFFSCSPVKIAMIVFNRHVTPQKKLQ